MYFFLQFSEETATLSLNIINYLVSVIEQVLLHEIGIEFFNIIFINIS
jgi:hypothetical protein